VKRSKPSALPQERDELERQVESLRREVRQLRLEQGPSIKANELLEKGPGVDLQVLSNREKTPLIDALREHYGLPDLLALSDPARSSHFYHRARAAVRRQVPGGAAIHHRHL
jgi:putative transposase